MDKQCFNKIGLGTVQFGLHYGINNNVGVVGYPEVIKIIEYYAANSINPLYDTAIAYGKSHEVLGKAFAELGMKNPKVVSKFSDTDIKTTGLKRAVETSLHQLNISSLFGFMAHDANILIENDAIYTELCALKKEELIGKMGVSVYYPQQVQWFLNNNKPIDLVQLPYNVFDQRFNEVIKKCRSNGIEVHVRSAFLQGLIFKEPSFFTGYFAPFKNPMRQLLLLAEKFNESVRSVALTFALMNEDIDRVIIGVDSKNNLMQNNKKQLNNELVMQLIALKHELEMHNEEVLLPFNWQKNEKPI